MTHATDIRGIYRRHAEACLAVLTKTTNPTSQAMLTAMAHTWLRLAESPAVTDASSDEQYRRNAAEALRRVSNARPDVQASWLRLEDSPCGRAKVYSHRAGEAEPSDRRLDKEEAA
jgi:hypothetical protein